MFQLGFEPLTVLCGLLQSSESIFKVTPQSTLDLF